MRFRCSCIRPVLAAVALLCLLAARSFAQCPVPPVAQFPLQAEGRPFIKVLIEGREAVMMVDTGAEVTTVTPEAAQLLDLPRDVRTRSRLQTVAGEQVRPNAILRDLSAGPLDFGRRSVPVVAGDSGNTLGGMVIAGLIGMDLFSAYDLEIDLPDHLLSLYPRNACSPVQPPWQPGTYTAVGINVSHGRRFLVPVILNERPISALLDSGAQGEVLTREAAERIGMSTIAIDNGPLSHGVAAGAQSFETRLFRFSSLVVGGETFRNVPLAVTDFRQTGVDMLLGLSFMRAHRLYIAPSAARLFVQPSNGQPSNRQPAPPVVVAMPGAPQGTAMLNRAAPPAAAPVSLSTPPVGIEHCRPPANMLPYLSQQALEAMSRPRLPIPAAVQARLTEGCAGVMFRVGMDGVPRDLHVLTEWPSGFGLGDYVRQELEGTRFRPGTDDAQALHFEAHRLHTN